MSKPSSIATYPRQSRYALAGVLALAAVVHFGWQVTSIISAEERDLVVWRSIDDTFYYLNTAWHVSRGEGMTFDRMSETNGVQPLWFGVTVALANVVDSKDHLYRGALIVSEALSCASILVILFFAQRYISEIGAALLSTAVFLMQTGCIYRIGLETNLNGLLVCLWLLSVARHIECRPRSTTWLTISSTLLVLCRIDSLIFVIGGVLAAWVAQPVQNRMRWTAMLPVVGLPLLVLALCMATLFDGRLLPVSGEAKRIFEKHVNALYGTSSCISFYLIHLVRSAWHSLSGFSLEFFFRTGIASYFVFLSLTTVTLFATATIEVWRHYCRMRQRPRRNASTVLDALSSISAVFRKHRGAAAAVILLATAVTHFLIDKLTYTYRGPVMLWHNVGEAMILATVACAWLGAMASPYRSKIRGLPIILAIALIAAMGYGAVASSQTDAARRDRIRCGFSPDLYAQRYAAAIELPQKVGIHEPIGVWNAGQIAYFSNLKIVNLDGLVNSTDYLTYLRARTLLPFLQKTGVRYLLDYDIRYWWRMYSDEWLPYETVHRWPRQTGSGPELSLVRVVNPPTPVMERLQPSHPPDFTESWWCR